MMETNDNEVTFLKNLKKEATKRIESSYVFSSTDNSNIEELHLYQAELEIQNEELITSNLLTQEALSLYSDLFNFSPVALFNLDPLGIIKDANIAATKLLTKDLDKLINRRFQAFLHPSYTDSFFFFLKNTVTQSEKQKTEVQLLDLYDNVLHVQLESVSFRRKEDGKTDIIIAVIDISERIRAAEALLKAHNLLEKKVKERTEDLQKTNEELNAAVIEKEDTSQKLAEVNTRLIESEASLKALNETKDKFFAIIAHDLRSPFFGLIGFANLMSNKIEQLSKEQILQYANHIRTLSQNLEKLVDDLLEWSTIQMDGAIFKPSKVSLCKIIHDTSAIFSVNAQEKNIIISSDCEEDIYLYGDEQMVKSILRNLLSNAIKFTKSEGKISFEILEEQNNDYINIIIRDTGVGMSNRVKERLFKIEEHNHSTGTANEKGTGLGLILSKEFVEKHGGTIRYESEVGQGTSFFVTLPKFQESSI